MQPLYLGIDVSKTTLHVANPNKFLKEIENTTKGHQRIVNMIRKQKEKVHVIVEASGGYERDLAETLGEAGITVTITQPSCVRYFAKSLGVLAKTDTIDAKVIATFGQATNPSPSNPTPENVRKIRALSDRREQVVEDRVREGNRLEACRDEIIREQIQNSIDCLNDIEKQLNRTIRDLLRSDEFADESQLLMQQTGVGEKTATVLLAHLPELGSLDRQQVAAITGLAPHARESGKWKGRRRIYGGRSAVRKALFMAARSAAQWCPILSEYYQRLRENGKPFKVAIIACARKLIVRLNTLMKQLLTTKQQPTEAVAT